MFVLVKLRDTVRIAPNELPVYASSSSHIDVPHNDDTSLTTTTSNNIINKNESSSSSSSHPPLSHHPLYHLIYDILSSKYSNYVIRDVGLIVSIYSIDSIDAIKIPAGDGGLHIPVRFTCISFQCYIGEVMEGRIADADSYGITVTLGFSENIFIPSTYMQHTSIYDQTEGEGVWIWVYEGNNLYMDRDQPIRLRIQDIIYTKKHRVNEKNSSNGSSGIQEYRDSDCHSMEIDNSTNSVMRDDDDLYDDPLIHEIQVKHDVFKQPMVILGSIAEDGLGMIEWWTEEQA
jgi:DNA-directed RNA polymerase subunit E'/Rpb7